jgi:hypothetical protein
MSVANKALSRVNFERLSVVIGCLILEVFKLAV